MNRNLALTCAAYQCRGEIMLGIVAGDYCRVFNLIPFNFTPNVFSRLLPINFHLATFFNDDLAGGSGKVLGLSFDFFFNFL